MEAIKGKIEHGDIAEGTEGTEVLAPKEATRKMEETKAMMEHGNMSRSTEILAPETATRKMEDTKKKAERTGWGDISEEPFWVVNTSGIILIMLVVLGHIYFF